MFSLHERTRRRLLVSGFVAFCLLPTLTVLGWSVTHSLHWHVADFKISIEHQLGLRADIESVTHPLPRLVRLHDLRLADPLTNQTILECSQVDVSRRVGMTIIEMASPTIHPGQLQPICRAVNACGTKQTADTKIQLIAKTVVVRDISGIRPLTDVDITSTRDGNATKLVARFHVVEMASNQTITIQSETQMTDTGVHTATLLDSGSGDIPIGLLASAAPDLRRCGPDCRFRGTARLQRDNGKNETNITGRIASIDTRALFADLESPPLAGRCSVTLDSATLVDGRLHDASGVLNVQGGSLSAALWRALRHRLDPLSSNGDSDNQRVPFRELAVRFNSRNGQLHLSGCCQSEASRILVDGGSGLLLRHRSKAETIALADLVPWLTSNPTVEVSWNRDTDWLLDRLPLPATTR